MPELPEVETIRRSLEKNIIGKKIAEVLVRKKKIVRGGVDDFIKEVVGKKIEKIERAGKLLIFQLLEEKFILVHLKMTGQLIFEKGKKVVAGGHKISDKDIEDLPNKYTHIIFRFTAGAKMFFNDMRQFGYMRLVDKNEKIKVENEYGIDPLKASFTEKVFSEIVSVRKKKIKTVLMEQGLIAGIGNIYADEICFKAGVRPDRSANSLSEAEKKRIHKECKNILKKAVKYKGTTFRDFRDGEGKRGGFSKFLKVYQREGRTCLKCWKEKIKKISVGGRGTRYCPVCQK